MWTTRSSAGSSRRFIQAEPSRPLSMCYLPTASLLLLHGEFDGPIRWLLLSTTFTVWLTHITEISNSTTLFCQPMTMQCSLTSSRRIMRKDVSPFWQMDFVSNTPTSRTDIDALTLSTIRYVRCTGPDRDDTWSAY